MKLGGRRVEPRAPTYGKRYKHINDRANGNTVYAVPPPPRTFELNANVMAYSYTEPVD